MSLMKAPKLEKKHLQALKTLVRLDFARAVRFKMEALQKNPGEHPAESTIKILTLTDMLADADQPLSVTMALMDMHGAVASWMPLTDARYEFYSATIARPVTEEDFRGVEADKLAVILEPLRQLQSELVEIFKNADAVDPAELFRQNGKGLSGSPSTSKGLVN